MGNASGASSEALRLKTWADYAPIKKEFETARSAERRNVMVRTARELYETQGIAHTSVKDVTETCGVARTLFYHYFADKEALTDAVIAHCVDEYMDAIVKWDQAWRFGGADVDGSFNRAYDDIVEVLKRPSSLLRAIISYERASLLSKFIGTLAESMAIYLASVAQEQYPSATRRDLERVRDWTYLHVAGLATYMLNHANTKRESVCHMIKTLLIAMVDDLGDPFSR